MLISETLYINNYREDWNATLKDIMKGTFWYNQLGGEGCNMEAAIQSNLCDHTTKADTVHVLLSYQDGIY